MAIQVELGKAFEYACIVAIYDALHDDASPVIVENNSPLLTAKNCYDKLDNSARANLKVAAKAALSFLKRAEPLLTANGESQLKLHIQPDSAGISGDVRDIVCKRAGKKWEVGISCKHNHVAVKHSRLSNTIDFGKEWLGIPCSEKYFQAIKSTFEELSSLRDNGVLWSSITDKDTRIYRTILSAFMDELYSLYSMNPNTPEQMLRYLLGDRDFYKVICNDSVMSTRIQAYNLYGTLNRKNGKEPLRVKIPKVLLPTSFISIDFKDNSNTTIIIVCDKGWQLSLRIHSARSKVEPSLKFDVQLIGIPPEIYTHDEPWEIE